MQASTMTDLPQPEQPISISLKEFLTTAPCPEAWQTYNLYIFRDGDVVFYIGQSYQAFERVWQHIRDAHKGRSVIGRFLLRNWPSSLHYTIDLLSAQAQRFACVNNDLTAAETALIVQYAPCFNRTMNLRPTPLPAGYVSPNGPLRCSRNLNQLIREAGYAIKAEQRRQLLAETIETTAGSSPSPIQ